MPVNLAALILLPLGHQIGHSFWITLTIGWLLAGVLMWMVSRIAGVKYVTLFESVIVAMVASGITWLCMMVFDGVPIGGTSLGLLLSLGLTLFLVKESFSISVMRALMVWGAGVIPLAFFGALHVAG